MIAGAPKELRPGEIASSFAVVWGPHSFTAHSKVPGVESTKKGERRQFKEDMLFSQNSVSKAGSTAGLEVTCDSNACACREIAAV